MSSIIMHDIKFVSMTYLIEITGGFDLIEEEKSFKSFGVTY